MSDDLSGHGGDEQAGAGPELQAGPAPGQRPPLPEWVIENQLQSRWITALHESGHIVAGIAASGGFPGSAVLLDDGGGMSYQGEELGPENSAIVTACGAAAERLAKRFPRPALPSGGLEAVGQEWRGAPTWLRKGVAADHKKATPDDVQLRMYGTDGYEYDPSLWEPRVRRVQKTAAYVVEGRLAEPIYVVAKALYLEGRIRPSRLRELLAPFADLLRPGNAAALTAETNKPPAPPAKGDEL